MNFNLGKGIKFKAIFLRDEFCTPEYRRQLVARSVAFAIIEFRAWRVGLM
jgi:hypothetical protein